MASPLSAKPGGGSYGFERERDLQIWDGINFIAGKGWLLGSFICISKRHS